MQDFQRQIEAANQVATLLGYVAPLMKPEQVTSLVEYLGDHVNPLVAVLLKPHFAQLEEETPALGLKALQGALSSAASFPEAELEFKATASSEMLYSVGPGVEEAISDTVFGSTTIERAAEMLLRHCSDPRTYVLLNAGTTLPLDVVFLPHRALQRASVLLWVAERLLPQQDDLHAHLAKTLCQVSLKLCHFEKCLEEAERFLSGRRPAAAETRSYLRVCEGVALGGLGRLDDARKALAEARQDALESADADPSALCFALSETYRQGLWCGDFTGLPEAGQRLFELLEKCKSAHVRCLSLGFAAICQSQLNWGDVAEMNSKVAVDSAHAMRLLDAEVDVRNLHATVLLLRGDRQGTERALVENLPLVTLCGHAYSSAEAEALVHRLTSRESPWLPESFTHDWQAALPQAYEPPFLASIYVTAGRARQTALTDAAEGARQLVPAVRACERLRKSISPGQVRRFSHVFIEVYRLFLDLPTHDFIQPAEHVSILRDLIELFAADGREQDEFVARAQLQLHYTRAGQRPAGTDGISALILEAALDPESPSTHVELAGSYLTAGEQVKARESCRRALKLSPDDPRANSLFALIAQQDGEWETAAEHYGRAIAADPYRPEGVYLDFAKVLIVLGQAREAAELLKPLLGQRIKDPLGYLTLAACYERLGDIERETENLVEFLKRAGGHQYAAAAQSRLEQLGRAHPTPEPEGVRSAGVVTASPSAPVGERREPVMSVMNKVRNLFKGKKRDGEVADIFDPSRVRQCSNCRRSVIDIALGTSKDKHLVTDNELAKIAGVTCKQCDGFFCVYPCSLPGQIENIRLCPRCRNNLIGVI